MLLFVCKLKPFSFGVRFEKPILDTYRFSETAFALKRTDRKKKRKRLATGIVGENLHFPGVVWKLAKSFRDSGIIGNIVTLGLRTAKEHEKRTKCIKVLVYNLSWRKHRLVWTKTGGGGESVRNVLPSKRAYDFLHKQQVIKTAQIKTFGSLQKTIIFFLNKYTPETFSTDRTNGSYINDTRRREKIPTKSCDRITIIQLRLVKFFFFFVITLYTHVPYVYWSFSFHACPRGNVCSNPLY